jgi:hypothetical protein
MRLWKPRRPVNQLVLSRCGPAGEQVLFEVSGEPGVSYCVTGIYAGWNQPRPGGYLTLHAAGQFYFQGHCYLRRDLMFADPIVLPKGWGFVCGLSPGPAQKPQDLVGTLVVIARKEPA